MNFEQHRELAAAAIAAEPTIKTAIDQYSLAAIVSALLDIVGDLATDSSNPQPLWEVHDYLDNALLVLLHNPEGGTQ